MAKGYAPDTTGEVEVQIVKFKVKGATPDLIDSLKNVAAALSGNVATAAAPRALRSVNAPGANGASGNGTAQAEYAEEDDEQTIEQELDPAPKLHRPPAKRKPRTLRLVEDINFAGNNGVSLKDFVAGLDLPNQMRRYAAIAAWFKQQTDTPEINVNHVYTAFLHIGWTMPKNPAQPFADLANQQEYRWVSAGKKRGEYTFNYIGEGELAKWRKGA
ncbi:MAG TPA: hypothetical protein VGD01_10320 [Candidatus Elarobacter sp.]|jgi:hypothetical protein